MVVTRVRVVSDSHLSDRTPEAIANWVGVVDDIASDPPDLVVHTGDISLDGADWKDDLQVAGDHLARIPTRLAVIPGNHDLGDNPHAGNAGRPGAQLITSARLTAYRSMLGPDHWIIDVPGWRLVGLNSLLFGSGLDAEGDQWDWLASVLDSTSGSTSPDGTAAAGPDAPPARVALFVHKPLLPPPGLEDNSPGRYLPAEARVRLLDLAAGPSPNLVVSGHVHQFGCHRHGDVTHVWAPSTWAVIPDRFQRPLADKVVGTVDVVLSDDGEIRTKLRRPVGVVHRTLVDDLPDPYTRF